MSDLRPPFAKCANCGDALWCGICGTPQTSMMRPNYEAAARVYATDYDNDWDTMSNEDKEFAIGSVKEYINAALEDNDD